MNTDPEELLAPGDAARVLGVTPDTVRLMSDDGRLSAMRTPGGRRLFKRQDVEKLAAKRAKAATAGRS